MLRRFQSIQYRFNEHMITNMLGAIYYSREDLIGIHVITDTGKVYNYGNHMNVIEYSLHTRNPHSVIDQVETRPVFAYGRQLCDLDEHKLIGSSRYRRMMSLYIGVRREL